MAEPISSIGKAELHLHLEGSLEPATVCEISPHVTEDYVRERYRYSDFAGFINAYKWLVMLLERPEHYAIAARRLFQRLASENVVYAEVNLSVGVMLWKRMKVGPIMEALAAEAAAAPLKVRWIFDAVRQFGPEEALHVMELAAEFQDFGVVGFGMGGDESKIATEAFASVYAEAKRRSLHLVPHAGETTTAESVWGALKLGAERIGHGIRAVEDAALMAELRRRDVPLEISISSNVATGAVASLEAHPVRALADAGVPLILNTDDPAMFHTTLNREYDLAVQLGFSEDELRQLVANSFKYAFDYAG